MRDFRQRRIPTSFRQVSLLRRGFLLRSKSFGGRDGGQVSETVGPLLRVSRRRYCVETVPQVETDDPYDGEVVPGRRMGCIPFLLPLRLFSPLFFAAFGP